MTPRRGRWHDGTKALRGILVLLLVTLAWVCHGADSGMASTLQALSHLGPHFRATGLSQLSAHLQRKPPAELTTPLTIENGDVVKGYAAEWEARLLRELLAVDLRHDILRIAIGSYKGSLMAQVKLQAAGRNGARFDRAALEQDAVTTLHSTFALSPSMASVDVWAVVPLALNIEYDHLPVFSVSATREQYEQATSHPRTAPHLLARLGLVRICPTYLQHASSSAASWSSASLPATAYHAEPIRSSWEQRLEAATVHLAQSNDAPVALFEGNGGTHGMAALTIDDGPHPLTTPLMLAVLRDHGVNATFFLVGEKAEEYPELVVRIVHEGHEIANHSHTHRRVNDLTDVEVLAEIDACQELIGRLTGISTTYFRPPGGRIDEAALGAVAAAEHTLLMWTNNADDWLKPGPDTIAANALHGLQPGGVILMHQGSIESFHALPLIIEGAASRGIRLGTASEMLAAGAARISRMSPNDAAVLLQHNGYAYE